MGLLLMRMARRSYFRMKSCRYGRIQAHNHKHERKQKQLLERLRWSLVTIFQAGIHASFGSLQKLCKLTQHEAVFSVGFAEAVPASATKQMGEHKLGSASRHAFLLTSACHDCSPRRPVRKTCAASKNIAPLNP